MKQLALISIVCLCLLYSLAPFAAQAQDVDNSQNDQNIVIEGHPSAAAVVSVTDAVEDLPAATPPEVTPPETVLASPAVAVAPAPTPAPPCCTRSCNCKCGQCFWSRESLTKGFFGLQPALAQKGVVADFQLTQFYQGVTSGGARQNFNYGGKLDYNFTFLGEPLGLNKGFMAIMHAETRFGEDVILDAAGLAPVNANMLMPGLENSTAITGLQFMQTLSEEWVLTYGKINSFDLFQMLYPQTGRGVDGFMNMSTFLPMTLARTLPMSFLGAGVLKMDQGRIQGAFLVYDSHNTPTTTGFGNLFSNGANVAGLWRFFTDFGDQPGSHLFLGTYASGEFTSLDPTGWGFVPGVGIVAPTETGSWSFTYILEQTLWACRHKNNRSIGLLSGWGVADPKTSPYGWVGNIGLQGKGILQGRQQDSMGVSYFYTGLSDDFKALVNPPLPLGNLQGVELYYNAAVTPWLNLTADLQFVEPSLETQDTAVVFGLRAKMDF